MYPRIPLINTNIVSVLVGNKKTTTTAVKHQRLHSSKPIIIAKPKANEKIQTISGLCVMIRIFNLAWIKINACVTVFTSH